MEARAGAPEGDEGGGRYPGRGGLLLGDRGLREGGAVGTGAVAAFGDGGGGVVPERRVLH